MTTSRIRELFSSALAPSWTRGRAGNAGAWKICAVFLLCAGTSIGRAQTITTLADFDQSTGTPVSALVQGADGNFYGATSGGGPSVNGTVFKITRDGAMTTLYNFSGPDGAWPTAGLVLATDGNFYGTTYLGGAERFGGGGTVFKITPAGSLTTLHSFSVNDAHLVDGSNPNAPLVQGDDGNLYGTTQGGARRTGYGL
jgi:uncharacterized repeat protein (TIGR03803 family)